MMIELVVGMSESEGVEVVKSALGSSLKKVTLSYIEISMQTGQSNEWDIICRVWHRAALED